MNLGNCLKKKLKKYLIDDDALKYTSASIRNEIEHL